MLTNSLPSILRRRLRKKANRATRVVALSFVLAALLASALVVGLRGGRAQSGAQPPDYNSVDDFTGGLSHLLRNDDLVMTFNYGSDEQRGVLFNAGVFDSTPQALNYQQHLIPNGFPGCSESPGCNYDYHQFVGTTPATGRFFNTVRDTTVHYPVQLTTQNKPMLVSLGTNTSPPPSLPIPYMLKWTSAQEIDFVAGANSFLAAVGDFNGDGYDDLLMGYSDTTSYPGKVTPKFRIATAANVNDPTAGFKFGPEFETNFFVPAIREMVVGDFNGDKLPEIAALFVEKDATLELTIFTVDPATLAISAAVSVPLDKLGSVAVTHALTMTVGKFTAASHQQLVVGYQIGAQQNFKVQAVDFDPGSVQPKVAQTYVWPTTANDPVFKLKAGRFKWSSPYDQIAWMSSTFSGGTQLMLLTLDPASLAVTVHANYVFDKDGDSNASYFGRDIAVGNFDHMQKSAADPTKKERNPDLQIAMIGMRVNRQNSQRGTAGVAICDISDDFSTITPITYTVFNESYFGGNSLNELSIAAVDMQGRSFRLGAGYKVTVDRTQPTAVLAVPPMHADYVSPGSGKPPAVLNLSIAPDGFNSEYKQSTGTDASATSTSTTSSSFSGEESVGGSVTLGQTNVINGDLENGVKITDTFTAKQDIKDSNDTINGAFNSSAFEISQVTGLSDVIWFKDSSYYLYVYPVIGRQVCVDKPGQQCQMAPMQIMFSAPKETTVQRLASDTLEWYQPPWEYGNLFSYPAGLPQLKQYIPNINLLTADLSVFATDDTAATLMTSWANGRTTGQNIEHEALFTEDNDLSVEGATDVKVLGVGASVTAKTDLNFGGSNGTRSLTESENKLSSSQGVTITKSAAFAEPFSYKYYFSPYIFGKVQPVGYTDPINSTADLLTYGTLRSAFTVDTIGSTSTAVGAWWSQSPYRLFPDVAVNHPNRWSYGARLKPSNGIVPSNCVDLGGGSPSMNCVTPTERDPDNPWRDAFHDMRGFFITNANNPVDNSNPFVAGSGGAQLENATAGDQLTLSTRVYNYSFKAMPAGSTVKVRFYGMEWNTEINYPADAVLDENGGVIAPGGKSFLIGEVPLSPIAPFDNGPKAPLNWVLAKTNFDTTPYANKALAFWVIVWIEDANGKLVQEVANHGLTGVPAGGPTAVFDAGAMLEQMVDNPLKASDDDPDKVSFSNNIGFYRSIFSVLPKTPSPTAGSGPTTVSIEKVDVGAATVKPGRAVEGSVMLRNGEREILGVAVYFYDGDPSAGGRLVDIERVGRLSAGSRQKVSINFRPQGCGSHRLYVRVAPGKQFAVTGQASRSVQVDCPAPVCVSQLCMKSAQYYALNLNRLPQGLVTVAGAGIDARANTSDAAKMRTLLQGGSAAQQKFNQQFVAAQLNLLALPGGGQAALRSNLLCYKANFQPTQLGTGVVLNPSMTLGELFDQARIAAKSGKAADMRQIAALLELLNGNDPQGRCR